MKKLFIIFCLFLTFCVFASEIDNYVSQSNFELKSTVSIYALDSEGNVLYKKNEQKLLNPASVLKVLTFGASYITLGSDYKFETALYLDNCNNLYLKLGGDTLLTTNNLVELFKQISVNNINNIYIDDALIDKTPYPQSWMEEDIWPYQRAITPYIIDNNKVQIALRRSSLATNVDIIQNDPYKMAIINELALGEMQDYKIKKMYGENSPIITFLGTISKDEIITLPVLNPELNFNIKLIKAIEKAGIKYDKKIKVQKIPSNSKKIASIYHDINEISKNILHNSDNFASEVVFKVAGAKYLKYSKSANLNDAIAMFNSIYPTENYEGIKIADASGVSRYNLLSSEFIGDCLRRLFQDEKFKNLLAGANEGTLKDRLIFLENNLKAKTGTLQNMSSIAGSLKSKEGKDIVFSIIVQNSPKRKAVLKNFENNVITILYRKF